MGLRGSIEVAEEPFKDLDRLGRAARLNRRERFCLQRSGLLIKRACSLQELDVFIDLGRK